VTAGAPRTALVHDWLTGMRGGEKVLAAIARRFPTSPIFTLFHLPGSVGGELESHPIHTSYLQRLPGLARGYRRYLPLFPAAIEDFDLAGYDLVVSTSHCVAKGVVPAPGSRHLCYCHTPMRYAWDQEHAYFPRRRGITARLRGHLLHRLRQWDVTSSTRVDRFVANSRFVAERIRRYYRREADVLPPPVATEFFTPGPEAAEGGGGYALLVSALAPYKRVEQAIAACERLGLELRVVGSGPERARLERLAGGSTRLLGAVNGERLRELYRGADLFLQPGTEDFGIAPVEALACGCPVVALGRGGVLDIVEDGVHGLLYDGGPDGAGSAEALAAAIDKSRGMRFNKLNLRERAEEFSEARFRDRFESLLEPWLSPDPSPPAA